MGICCGIGLGQVYRPRRCIMRGKESDDEYGDEESGWGAGALSEHLDTTEETEIECPYCGEVGELVIDRAGGATQDYVQDCEVCCRPWQVHVTLGVGGAIEVKVEQSS
jgi:hypothetical protein